MAVITEINGVSTAGTTGVNNIFGSGSGGASSPTPSPGTMLLVSDQSSGNSFGSNGAFINVSTLTYPQFKLEVLQSDGTNIVPTPEEYTVDFNAGFALLEWEDATNYLGSYTVNVEIIDMGASPAEIPSSTITSTYTRVAPQFKYYRMKGVAQNGTQTSAHVAMSDFQIFTGPNATGTQITGSNSGTYLSSNTGSSFDAEAAFNFSSYYPYKVFDNSLGIGGSWWSLTLSNNSPQDNYVQIKFKDQTESATSAYATAADFPAAGSVRVRFEANGSATHFIIQASDTGAFAGEEYQYGGTNAITSGTYQVINA